MDLTIDGNGCGILQNLENLVAEFHFLCMQNSQGTDSQVDRHTIPPGDRFTSDTWFLDTGHYRDPHMWR